MQSTDGPSQADSGVVPPFSGAVSRREHPDCFSEAFPPISRRSGFLSRYQRDPRLPSSQSNVSPEREYTIMKGTLRVGPNGSMEISLESPRLSCTNLDPPTETPAEEVRCTCGAIVRKALPGYEENEANGCELTRRETEHCEKAKKSPSRFDTTNCSGKLITSVENTIRRRQRMYQPWWSQNQKRVLHDADLKKIAFGELQSGDDNKDTAWNKFVHRHIRQKAKSCQDIGTTLEQTHGMRAYFNRDRAGRGRQVSWPETEMMRSASNEDGASQW